MTDSAVESRGTSRTGHKAGVPRSRVDHDSQDRSHRDQTSKDEDGRRHRRHKQNRKEENKPKATIPVAHPDTSLQQFFEDRKGDRQNLVYGGLDRSAVPLYNKFGRGGLVGLDRNLFRISQDTSNPSIEERGLDLARGFRNRSLLTFRPTSTAPNRVIAQPSPDTSFVNQHSYITLDPDRRKRRKLIQDDEQDHHENERTNQGASDESTQSDVASDSSTDEDSEPENAFEVFRNDANRVKMVELARATAEKPIDMDAWLALIEHHDWMVGWNDEGFKTTISNNEKCSLAETKIALYEKALSKIKLNAHRETLIAGLMKEGTKIWDTRKVASQWQAVLKLNSFPALWILYLNFQQSNFIMFTYDQCLSVYREYLSSILSQQSSFERDESCIYVLLRLTVFMTQAGYMERATAIWQALLEFTFFIPDHLDSTTENASFEEFWESEVSRIGEDGATGWGANTKHDIPPKTDADLGPTSGAELWKNWITRESRRVETSNLAARTIDNITEDDPFRVILFSDIKDFLLRPATSKGRTLLINAFFRFCNMPPLYYPGIDAHQKWWTDPYLVWGSELTRIGQGLRTPSIPCPNLISETAILFSNNKEPSTLWTGSSSSEDRVLGSWQRSVMKLLVSKLNEDDLLAEYNVASEANADPHESRKYAKSLLKKRPCSLRLYNAYALVECQLANLEAAEHVWSTAISMNSKAEPLDQSVTLLWRSWVWQCLEIGDVAKAERLLLSLPNGKVDVQEENTVGFLNSTATIRTQNHLRSQLAHYISLRQHDPVLHFCELLAIYTYLTTNKSLDLAFGVYTNVWKSLAKDRSASILMESLHQSRARLLHLHTESAFHNYRPSEIRIKLTESVREFPNNTMFLHFRHSVGIGLLDRVRQSLPDFEITRNEKRESSVGDIFQIWVEISRPSYGGSTVHSIRAAFERALKADFPWSSSVLVWEWYIRWETQLFCEGESRPEFVKKTGKSHKATKRERNRAIEVYYRGIQACPWTKRLYLLAFSQEILRRSMGDEALRRIYDMMIEKGIRVHTDIDDLEEQTAT